jgi:hypothetical protein
LSVIVVESENEEVTVFVYTKYLQSALRINSSKGNRRYGIMSAEKERPCVVGECDALEI